MTTFLFLHLRDDFNVVFAECRRRCRIVWLCFGHSYCYYEWFFWWYDSKTKTNIHKHFSVEVRSSFCAVFFSLALLCVCGGLAFGHFIVVRYFDYSEIVWKALNHVKAIRNLCADAANTLKNAKLNDNLIFFQLLFTSNLESKQYSILSMVLCVERNKL